jgi:5-methylcytosine-specific restriction endonuclease McrA
MREKPLCEIRARCNGAPVDEVDHIMPISKGGARLDRENLQSTCWACHVWKTAKFDKKGIRYERRT